MKDAVTPFWDNVRAKWPNPVPPLTGMTLHDQLQLMQAINSILFLLSKYEQKQDK
jgi:hypothetical protein